MNEAMFFRRTFAQNINSAVLRKVRFFGLRHTFPINFWISLIYVALGCSCETNHIQRLWNLSSIYLNNFLIYSLLVVLYYRFNPLAYVRTYVRPASRSFVTLSTAFQLVNQSIRVPYQNAYMYIILQVEFDFDILFAQFGVKNDVRFWCLFLCKFFYYVRFWLFFLVEFHF